MTRTPGDDWHRSGSAPPPRRDGHDPSRRRRSVVPMLVVLIALAAVGIAGYAYVRSTRPAPPPPTPTEPALVPLTFPEGYRYTQMAETVGRETRLSEQRYLDLAGPSARGAKLAGRSEPTSLEGFLFPATYQIGTDTTEDYLIDRQIEAFRDVMSQIDLRAARRKNLTRYDVVIIASMIEREVRVPSERAVVAGVMYNRLRLGMRLDIDATVQYAVGDWRELTGSDLRSDSPYNTRRFSGLPPGPICNPGEASLRAAANPKQSDFLYYVAAADGSGRHIFATTLDEFNRIQVEQRG